MSEAEEMTDAEYWEVLAEMDRREPGDGHEHDWPAELDSDARCERCGLEYGQWTVEEEKA